MNDLRKNLRLSFGIFGLIIAWLPANSSAGSDGNELVLIGSGHKNVYEFLLDTKAGFLKPLGEVAEVMAPSFLAVSPTQPEIFYAISEGGGKKDSFVSAFRIASKTGRAALLNRRMTGGSGPCHVSVDRAGKVVLVANYNSGSVAAFPVQADGSLGAVSTFIQDKGSSINSQRQEGPHAHCIITDPDDRFVFWCDLGLDKIMVDKIDVARGTLMPNDPPFATVKAGLGPRHIVFHPNRKFAYVITEMGSTITAFAYDRRRGALSEIENYPLLPADVKGESWAAEVAVHPSGKFVFGSNRGDDSLAVFACDRKTGRLNFIERVSTGGKTPRNFEVDPSGRFLLVGNQDSNTVVVFSIDLKSGHLRATGGRVEMDAPMCVKFANAPILR